MERDKKYAGDFVPKYKNAQEIEQDSALLPSDKVRELVKHYSMCLFGLATDMASAERRLKSNEILYEQTRERNRELRAKIKILENYADPEVKKELPQLRKKITMQLQDITEKNALINNLHHQLKYWKEKTAALEQENAALKEQLKNGK